MNAYLDNHTSTKACKTVTDFMQEDHSISLPHAPHELGVKGFHMLDEALEILSSENIFGDKRENCFFSSWLEAINTVFMSFFINEISETGKNQILILETEDAPIFYAVEKLKHLGCTAKIIPLDNSGSLDLEALKSAIGPKTSFFSCSFANGLSGVIHPIEQILQICKEKNIKTHVDLSYTFGKIPCQIDADFLTCSSHLLHGFSGACISAKRKDFFSQNEITSIPLWSQDPLNAKVFSLALKQALLFSDKMTLEVARKKKHFEKIISKEIVGVETLFQKSPILPNVSVLYFPKIHAEALLYRLNKKGIYATFGGGVCQPLFSLLEKAHFDSKYRYSSLSFALSRYTTKEEIEKAALGVKEEVLELQCLSEDL